MTGIQRLLFWIMTAVLLSLLSLPYSGISSEKPRNTLHIASFNIHYIVPNDANEDWEERKYAVASVLKDMDADIVAFQEMETFEGGHFSKKNIQLDWVISSTSGYKAAAVGDPQVFPHTQPIIYKPDKYRVIDQGFFFFSKTPDKIYSRQWDGRYPYFCSWVHLEIKNGQKDFFVFNVHNDFKSRGNRLKTSKLIADRIRPIVEDNSSIVVLGDFNAPRWAQELELLVEAGLNVVTPSGSTNRLFGLSLLPAIDHILVSADFQPQGGIRVWRDKYDGIYPADHYPISTLLAL